MTPRQRKTERGRKKNDDANKPSAALAEYASGYQRGKRRLIFATFVLIAASLSRVPVLFLFGLRRFPSYFPAQNS
jgi:hypothetical protein